MSLIRTIGAIFFGLLAAVEAVTVVQTLVGEPLTHAAGGLAATATFLVIAWALWPGSVSARKRGERLCGEALEFFGHVNSTRNFPAPLAQRVLDKPARPILAACNARLVELTTQTNRAYAGTRIKVGAMPFYIGGSAPIQRIVTKDAVSGELAATSKGLVFVGDVRTLDIPYAKIESVDTGLEGFSVSVSGLQRPVYFATPNGVLWGALVKNLVRLDLDTRTLPPGAQLEPV